MGVFADREIEIMDLSAEGYAPLVISTLTKTNLEEVLTILSGDPDIDPYDYAEFIPLDKEIYDSEDA
jgi:hypothetical protein